MLGYESYWFTSFPAPGAIECEQYLVVMDLRNGRILHRVPVGTSSPPSICFGPVLTMIVKSDGATAWIAEDVQTSESEPDSYEAWAVDKTGARLLVSGPEIEPYSLTLGGSTLYWTQGGKPLSASLD
jgi:glucose dehydrogenase